MKARIKNALLEGLAVAASLETGLQDILSWVGIYPIIARNLYVNPRLRMDCDDIPAVIHDKYIYRVYIFEVPKQCVDNDWDITEYEMTSHKSKIIFGFDALEAYLHSEGIDSDTLIEPWKCDYPL